MEPWTQEMKQRMLLYGHGLARFPHDIRGVQSRKYNIITPEDGSEGLKDGDRWAFYVVTREETSIIDGKTEKWYLYLSKIEQRKENEDSFCFTWALEKEKALRIARKKEARSWAEKARGEILLCQKTFRPDGKHKTGPKGEK